jgi:FKBP-type peptidyl-prolyl cis-trans isomerase
MIALQHQRLAGAVRHPQQQQQPLAPLRASRRGAVAARASADADADVPAARRAVLLSGAAAALLAAAAPGPASAMTGNPLEYKKELKRRRRKIDESEYTEGPKGLKIYDIVVGTGQEAKAGDRVAVHFELKLRGVTIYTTRVGMGVTGGNPAGFDLGQPAGGPGAAAIEGLDLGVQGMRVGGVRALLIPPSLGYGDKSLGEIQPNSTLNVTVELLSIKTSPLGYRVKLVEG